jgi:hypothetical protein
VPVCGGDCVQAAARLCDILQLDEPFVVERRVRRVDLCHLRAQSHRTPHRHVVNTSRHRAAQQHSRGRVCQMLSDTGADSREERQSADHGAHRLASR